MRDERCEMGDWREEVSHGVSYPGGHLVSLIPHRASPISYLGTLIAHRPSLIGELASRIRYFGISHVSFRISHLASLISYRASPFLICQQLRERVLRPELSARISHRPSLIGQLASRIRYFGISHVSFRISHLASLIYYRASQFFLYANVFCDRN